MVDCSTCNTSPHPSLEDFLGRQQPLLFSPMRRMASLPQKSTTGNPAGQDERFYPSLFLNGLTFYLKRHSNHSDTVAFCQVVQASSKLATHQLYNAILLEAIVLATGLSMGIFSQTFFLAFKDYPLPHYDYSLLVSSGCR